MKIKLLTNIVFEYSGIKKTMFKAGNVFVALPSRSFVDGKETNIVDGFWIGQERTALIYKDKLLNTKGDAPGMLIQTKVFLNECGRRQATKSSVVSYTYTMFDL